MNIKLKQSQGQHIEIESKDSDVINHFYNHNNCCGIIIDQFEHDLYSFYFKDKKDKKDKKDLNILDIGANVGLFSLHVLDCAKNIYSVEPTPSCYSLLNKLTEDIPNITTLNYALSEKNENVTFYINENNSTMNSLFDRSSQDNKIEVNGIDFKTLFDKINNIKIDFCKIDIEGSELKSITNETFKEVAHLIDNLFIEVHEVDGKNFSSMIDHFISIFNQNGYKTLVMGHDGIFASKIKQDEKTN